MIAGRRFWRGRTHLLGLGLLVRGEESVRDRALQLRRVLAFWGRTDKRERRLGGTNLDGTADTEDTVVGLLGRQTLDGLLDSLALLGDQVIEPMANGLVTVVGRKWSKGEIRSDRGGRMRHGANGNDSTTQCPCNRTRSKHTGNRSSLAVGRHWRHGGEGKNYFSPRRL